MDPIENFLADFTDWFTPRLAEWEERANGADHDISGGLAPMPAVAAAYGLPDVWEVLDNVIEPESTYHLVRRLAGGWATLGTPTQADQTSELVLLVDVEDTLADLYATVRENVPASDPVLRMVRNHVVTLYDPNDPTEAAEQTLAALGGPLRLMPAAART